jgi:hypothetical protein
MYVVDGVSRKKIDWFSTGSWALHAFHEGILAGWVAANDSLESLVALNVVGYALEE